MFLDDLKAQFPFLRIAHLDRIVPCTEAEVAALEQQIMHPLPAAYREFLLWMGKWGAGFMQGSDCWYSDLPNLASWAAELLEEVTHPEPLPKNAFVFWMHQGYHFNFFVLGAGDDPVVYDYDEAMGHAPFQPLYPTFSAFLSKIAQDEAQIVAGWSEQMRAEFLNLD